MTQHGGKREGAGRPARKDAYVQTSIDIRADQLAWIDEHYSNRRVAVERALSELKTKEWMLNQQWANAMLDEATDLMDEKRMEITPESLSRFFEKEYELPLSRQEASAWLAKQEWYIKSFVDENGPDCNGHCDGCNQSCATWEDNK